MPPNAASSTSPISPGSTSRRRRLIAVEALLRWRHPEFGDLPTDQFIAVAEASGLIGDIGRWVLGAACDQGRRWRDAGHPVRIAVNLSAVEFRHPNLPQQIAGALAQARLDPSLLELEITESAYMEREADKPHPGVEEVRRLGVGWRSTISAPAGRRWPT